MQKYLKKAVRSGENGLYLCQLPTGYGKSYGTLRAIADWLHDPADHRKIIYLTTLTKNLPTDTLKTMLADEPELYENNVLRLRSNLDEVSDKLPDMKIPEEFQTENYQMLLKALRTLQQAEKNRIRDTTYLDELRCRAMQAEAQFRHEIMEKLRQAGKSKTARLACIRSQNRYHWIGELYPAVYTDSRRVLFMTVKKFLGKNATLIEPSYDFLKSDMLNHAIIQKSVYDDNVLNPLISGENGLHELIQKVIAQYPDLPPLDDNWSISPYVPTPTIIEAARTLYESHSVEDITRHEADKVSTDATISCILDVINRSKKNSEKSICFVTGVPGAGKTLVGLEVAVRQTYQGHDKPVDDEGAVYLSGNGPLVAVLTEALAKDNYEKCKARRESKKITDSRREVGKFINMIHRYRDNMLAKIKNPVENGVLEIDPEKAVKMAESGYGEVEHVAIFDEAQRSWTHKRLAEYLKRGGTYGNKLKVPNFPMSEAGFLIWSLDQREDWATIVCLVGGGQEINTGEAGISEWINALNNDFPNWKVYISPKLTESEYAEGRVNELLKKNRNVTFSADLHLSVNLRSFRAEKLSTFVHMLLSFDRQAQNGIVNSMTNIRLY